ncbi:HK97-gp10 family putative phage morphogenesis protein [Oxalobacteraceae bacterium A2-2]
MSFTVDLSGLDQVQAKLRQFGHAIQSEVAIEGAAAMAKVMQTEAQHLAPSSTKEHWFYGTQFKKTGKKYLFQPGNLRRAIYRVYSREKSSLTVQTYRVSWNHTKAPYGYMVEFGTARAAAHPFMRPAVARMPDAIAAGKAAITEKLSLVMGEL